MLKLRPHLVSSVHMLFPTLSHMQQTDNGRRLSPLFSRRLSLPVRLTTTAFSLLPTRLVQTIVGLITGQPSDSALVTASLVTSPCVVAATLSMAREEMLRITELDKDVLRTYGDRMRFYWARKDGWVLESAIAEIGETLEGSGYKAERRLRCAEGMAHAFCVVDEHAASLAGKCVEWIRQDGIV